MRLLFVGDIMPGGVLPYQVNWISESLLQYLNEFDCRIGTLECALGDDIPFDVEKMRGKMNIIYSPSSEINRLKKLGINVVSLANNHVYDLGQEGLENTIKLLKRNNIKYCGAGINIENASKPAVITINGKSIAFLAWCQYGSVYIGHLKKASTSEPGVNPLDIDRCVEQIKAAKSQYDYVFALPHWGNEYQYLPTPECREYALKMLEAGADGVFASHTHQVQPLTIINGKPIAYSMGNFLFPDYYMQPPRPIWYPQKGFDSSQIERIHFYPKRIDSPSLHIWRHISRIGLMIEFCDFNEEFHIKSQLSYLNSCNILDKYERPYSMNMRLRWMGRVIKSANYPFLFRLYHSKWNIPRRMYHLITRVF